MFLTPLTIFYCVHMIRLKVPMVQASAGSEDAKQKLSNIRSIICDSPKNSTVNTTDTPINKTSKRVELKMIYYEQKPFIYMENGTLTGIFAEIRKNAKQFCGLRMTFEEDLGNISYFTETLTNSTKNAYYLREQYVWMPLIQLYSEATLQNLNLSKMSLFVSPGMEVIVHRDTISLLNKLFYGVESTSGILILALFLLVIFAAAIWALVSIGERTYRNASNKRPGAYLIPKAWVGAYSMVGAYSRWGA